MISKAYVTVYTYGHPNEYLIVLCEAMLSIRAHL
jgi:hypothetical protein